MAPHTIARWEPWCRQLRSPLADGQERGVEHATWLVGLLAFGSDLGLEVVPATQLFAVLPASRQRRDCTAPYMKPVIPSRSASWDAVSAISSSFFPLAISTYISRAKSRWERSRLDLDGHWSFRRAFASICGIRPTSIGCSFNNLSENLSINCLYITTFFISSSLIFC